MTQLPDPAENRAEASNDTSADSSGPDDTPRDGEHKSATAYRLLVVDDEPDIPSMVRRRLRAKIRSSEYELCFAADGQEALDLLNAGTTVDMVVTDISMPRMDGLALLGHITSEWPDVVTVMASAYGDMARIRRAMNHGAADFVTKPLDFEDLETTIERCRTQQGLRRQAQANAEQLKRLQSELQLAAEIQNSIMPQELPDTELYRIDGRTIPARVVGGDFYDVIPLSQGRIGLAVADVSDKGVPAALFMMSSRTVLRACAIGREEPAETLTEMNRLLSQDNPNAMFLTLLYAAYEPDTGRLTMANAGHCDPLVTSADGGLRVIPGNNELVVGLNPNFTYSQLEHQLQPGDTLVIYTDGVTEARASDGSLLGEEGLNAVLGQPAHNPLASVINAVQSFARGAEQADDITCMTLTRRA